MVSYYTHLLTVPPLCVRVLLYNWNSSEASRGRSHARVYQIQLNMYWQVPPLVSSFTHVKEPPKKPWPLKYENVLETLTVTRTQCKSMGSPPLCFPAAPPPRISARRRVLFTLRMLMSFSQQNAWIRVKWICKATSLTSSSSVARMHKTTLSGSLEGRGHEQMS